MTLPLQIYRPFLGAGDFSEIYLEESTTLSIRWEDGKIETMTSSESNGAGLRILIDLETRFGHTDLSKPLEGTLSREERERLQSIHQQLSDGCHSREGAQTGIRPPADGNPGLKDVFLDPRLSHSRMTAKKHAIRIDPRLISLDEKIKLLQRADEAARAGSHVRQVGINYGEKTKTISILNSLGEVASEDRVYLVFSITVTTEKEGKLQTAYDSMGGLLGYELFEEARVEKLAKEVSIRAHKKLDAPPAPVGPMRVVIASSAGGTLIHEAVGHSLEADAVLEGTSPSYRGKLGQVVGNEKLNVFDDPTVPSKRGSFHFDDEGTPSERTQLIENGVLKNYLYDRVSAKRADVMSNGHGRRESYAHPPIPRMSNTFVGPGTEDPHDIVESLKEGLVVTKMGGGQVNTANGDFVFDVEEGFSVKNGRMTLVRGATLLGNGPQVLRDIEAIGSDHGWAIGTCGKEGQGVPVSDALPTIKIKSLVIGGGS